MADHDEENPRELEIKLLLPDGYGDTFPDLDAFRGLVPAERRVPVAPQHRRRDLHRRAPQIRGDVAGEVRPIPVQRSGEGPGLQHGSNAERKAPYSSL